MKTKLFLTGLAIIAATTMLNAQTSGNGNVIGKGKCKGTACVDNNRDGICDNYQSRKADTTGIKSKGQGNRDGTCIRQGIGNCKGKNFVDVNKNGVCDNYEARIKK